MSSNIERLYDWCSLNDITVEEICPAFMGSEAIFSIKYKGCIKSVTRLNSHNDTQLSRLMDMINIWKQMIDLNHAVFYTPDYAAERQSESRLQRISMQQSNVVESLPSVPKRIIINCNFCDAKDLDNFYTGSSGRVACPECFKERVSRQLAKEKV